jgi:glutamate synthase (ferredoxin)
MSGGIAYIFDVKKQFENGLCNMEMVALEELEGRLEKLRRLIKITLYIPLAGRILEDWKNKKHFIKVMPKDYKIALQRLAEEKLKN